MYVKDFDTWNEIKKRVNSIENKINIRAGEIRWIAFGINIGSEIDGKGTSFTRPGLIFHVISSHLALIVPLSSKVKNIAGYIPFEWKGNITGLCIHQMRIISQKRILSRKGRISLNKLDLIKNQIKKFYNF